MKKGLVFCIFIWSSWWAMAQEVLDTFDLAQAEVISTRVEKYGLGQVVQEFDSTDLLLQNGAGLDDLLAAQSTVFIKSYGAGSLASPASRGTGFGHTAVLWNGFNLQSPLNGGIDFSLLPMELTDEVKLQQGGSGALYGSGAIGGVVHLQQKASNATGLHGALGFNVGSFSRLGQQLKLSYGTKKWMGDFRVLHDQAKNNFPFGENNNRAVQTNAELRQWAFTQHNQFILKDNQLLKTWAWVQTTDRQVPPNRIQNNTNAEQRDSSFRFAAEWQRFGQQHNQKLRAAWLDERFEFTSDLQAPDPTRSKSLITEFENDWNINEQQQLLTGINYTNEVGIAPTIFASQVQRNRIAAFVSYRQAFAKWQTIVNLRQEIVVNASSPFTGSFALKSPEVNGWMFETQVSKNYKLPTFNDLYWTGSQARGNEQLQAEQSWSMEGSLTYQIPDKAYQWSSRLTGFNILVNDWILWVPQTSGVWQPDNLRKVWSRGIEATTTYARSFDQWSCSTTLLYQYNPATNQRVYAGATQALEKQLIHVPLHTARAHLKLKYRKSQLIYRHQYTGSRFTTSDNLSQIAPYQLGDLIFLQSISVRKNECQLQVRLENIWNTSYEVLRYRPMPGRGLWGALKFLF